MVRSICIAAAFVSAANLLSAQDGGGMGGGKGAGISDVSEESLIMETPNKWSPYYKESEHKVDTFMFPEEQQPGNWEEAIHYERFLSTQGVTEASQVYELKTQASAANCASHDATLIVEDIENGYSIAESTEQCTAQDKSVTAFAYKTILGNEQLYVVRKIWKYEPKRGELKKWREFIHQVYLCDPTIEASPCVSPSVSEDS